MCSFPEPPPKQWKRETKGNESGNETVSISGFSESREVDGNEECGGDGNEPDERDRGSFPTRNAGGSNL
jgi:hypothetical protein